MDHGSPTVLAFDVGGTDIKAGLVSFAVETGAEDSGSAEVRTALPYPRIMGLSRFTTPRTSDLPAGEAVVRLLAELSRRYHREHPGTVIEAIGVIVPGLVDEVQGVGIYSANLGWRDFPFRQALEAALEKPVAFGHDVGAAGDAELTFNASHISEDAMVLIIGTGIAAAFYADGRRLRGGGYAGEIGHALIPVAGELHLVESRASAGAIALRYREASPNFAGGAREVLSAARSGEPQAQRIWSEAVQALGLVIAQSVAMLGTRTVIIGGGLSEAGDELFDPLAQVIDDLLTFQPRPVLRRAALGQEAGLIGSALTAHRMLQESS